VWLFEVVHKVEMAIKMIPSPTQKLFKIVKNVVEVVYFKLH
jgi:hypothetical protein